MSTPLGFPFPFKTVNDEPLDSKRGPWESVAAAYAGVPVAERDQGLTVVVLVTGKAVEYWWKDGVQDADLIPKDNSFTNAIIFG